MHGGTIARYRFCAVIVIRAIALGVTVWNLLVLVKAAAVAVHLGDNIFVRGDTPAFKTQLSIACGQICIALALGFGSAWIAKWIVPWSAASRDCQRCGYSIEGLVGSVCPECGDRFRGELSNVAPKAD